MKMKVLGILILLLAGSACGKKSTVTTAQFAVSKALTDTEVITKTDVSEHSCIDNKLTRDLDSGESIKKMVTNSDFTFCNGVRLRLKTYLFASKKYKAYGVVHSNSGLESCLTESDDFTHTSFLGDQGVLNGLDIKILVGGHQFDSSNKIVPSEHRLARHVKFDWGAYSGELAFLEKGKVRCWAIQ
jgi:hypothetical protein